MALQLPLLAALAGVPAVPDRCWCDAHQTVGGAACAGQPALNCGFDGMSDTFQDVLDCMATVGQLPFVTNLTLTNSYAAGLAWNDPEYGQIGAAFGSEPLRSRLLHAGVVDQRENGATESDVGLAAFGAGIGNMTKLRSVELDNRWSLGIGSLRCPNGTAGDAAPVPPPLQPAGLAGLGRSLSRLHKTLRFVKLNFDAPNGGYSICDAAVEQFATNGLAHLEQLEAVDLGLNFMSVGDRGAAAIGRAIAALPKLRGVNLRLRGSYVVGEGGGIQISAAGLTALAEGVGNATGLGSVALALGEGRVNFGDAGIAALASGLAAQGGSLEALWLQMQDACQAGGGGQPPCPRNYSPLVAAIKSLSALKALHADIVCLSCTEGTAWQCRGSQDPPLSTVVAGKCIDCSVEPEPDACHCWQDASWGCTPCDAGNLPVNASSCTDF